MDKKRNKKRDYVNNPDFLNALMEYKKRCREAEDQGEERPVVPNYVAHCIFQIATRLATRPNFSGYSFKEDMVMDGVENCLLYMDNFNPEKTENAFAYFTQIIWYAFIRRIQKEKKQMYIKYKSSHEMLAMGETAETDEIKLHLNTDVDYINSFISDFEEKMEKDKAKKK